jgi:PKD repeat protein
MRSDRQHRRSGRTRISILSGVIVAALGLAVLSLAPTASADTAPLPPVTTPTVSADGLPTVQVNGVVWNQVIVGNTVYATGAFTKARPAGSALGVNETDRSNLLAYNLTTGALVTGWAPTLNAQGLTIAASTDGTRIYVGGDFTTANGVTRNRIAAFDATSGALVTTFGPGVNGRVRSIVVTADTVYVGGSFNSTGGQSRLRLAAYATSNGALRTWAPSADQEVMALTVVPNLEVVVGGHFTTMNSVANAGMAAVDPTTGALLPWAVNTTIRNYGPDAAIWSLSNDGTNVYGTGYGYLVNGGNASGANLENSFAAVANGGALIWANGCHGDTYGNFARAGVLYTVGHPHECSSIGGHPQTDPWTFQRAMATTITRGPNDAVNNGGDLNGLPAPELLHWLPTLAVGSYTGQYQAAWTITGNSQYVLLGGEFLTVNGIAQQGLVRMPVTAISPNKQGPQISGTLTPTVVSLAAGRVRVSWQSSWDRDNRTLTYEVLRGSTVANSTVLATLTQDSAWWNRPNLFVNDTTAPAGSSQTYRIRVKDAFSNTGVSAATAFTVPAGTPSSAYTSAVLGDGATHLWRLGEASGTNAYDWVAADDLTLDASATRGADGALINEPAARSTTFSGSAAVPAVTPAPVVGPQTFAVEAWIKTTTTSGGKIIGFGDSRTGNSGNYDRHVYMLNDGRLAFGVNGNGLHTPTSPLTYNDGQWHQVVASIGSTGAELYVDGKRVARDTGAAGAQAFTGYWRIGGDNLGGWPNQPASSTFAGGIEEAAVYPAPLTLAQVQAHYQASGRNLNLPTRPTDAYGAAVWDAGPSFFYRLDEPSGTIAIDRTTNSEGGTYTGGVLLGQAGAPASTAGTSVTFPGGSEQTMISNTQVENPTVYSLETWFRTTTTHGGRLLGFGNAASGYSSSYDRHIYMLNNGSLRYGIYTGNTEVVDSPKSYNDGEWHQVVATQGSGGMQLFVDGVLVGTGAATTPQNYSGYWRLGSDNTWGGADTNDFAGSFDETAVYDSVLSASTVNAHYQLGKPASANVKPTAAFSSSVTNLTAAFDATGSVDPDGSIASYSWNFGDGSTDTGATPSHTYAAAGDNPVTLTVTDNQGATDTVTHTVTTTVAPNVKPTAAFASTCTNLACTFNSSASADSDGSIASYDWDFGDGGSSTVANPSHTFTAGTYDVKLTVTDNRGGTDSITQPVTVAAANQSPVAAFTSSTTNLAATFDSSASADADGSIASRSWDFGDGGSSTLTSPSHTYAAAGTYSVVLTVTDNKGATGTASSAVTVTAPANVLPTAAFSSSCTNLACTFNSSAAVDPDGVPLVGLRGRWQQRRGQPEPHLRRRYLQRHPDRHRQPGRHRLDHPAGHRGRGQPVPGRRVHRQYRGPGGDLQLGRLGRS